MLSYNFCYYYYYIVFFNIYNHVFILLFLYLFICNWLYLIKLYKVIGFYIILYSNLKVYLLILYNLLCLSSKTQAIQAQFMTAIAAVLGTSIGLLAQRSPIWEELLLSFTAGGFLYLATVNILPTIVHSSSNSSGSSNVVQTILELICFILGILMMVFVTFLE